GWWRVPGRQGQPPDAPQGTAEDNADAAGNPADSRRFAGALAELGQGIAPNRADQRQHAKHHDPVPKTESLHTPISRDAIAFRIVDVAKSPSVTATVTGVMLGRGGNRAALVPHLRGQRRRRRPGALSFQRLD